MNENFRSTAIWIYKTKWWRGLNLLLSKANVGYVYCKELRWNKVKANESLFFFFSWPQCSSSLNREQVSVLIGVNHSMLPGWSDKPVHCCWSLYFQLGNWKELQVTSVFPAGCQGDPEQTKDKSHTRWKVSTATATSLRGLLVLHPQYLPLLVIYGLIQIPLKSQGSP